MDININNVETPIREWESVTIETDYQRIHIYGLDDTVYCKTWQLHYEGFEPSRINRKDTIFFLKAEERDSIFKIVYKMITSPLIIDKRVTDYVGSLKVCIEGKATELCCSYSSTNDWTTISPETQKLFSILNSKIEIRK